MTMADGMDAADANIDSAHSDVGPDDSDADLYFSDFNIEHELMTMTMRTMMTIDNEDNDNND